MRLDVKISFAEEVQSFVWTFDRRRSQTFVDKNLTSNQSVAAEKLYLADWILDLKKVEIKYYLKTKYESFWGDAIFFWMFWRYTQIQTIATLIVLSWHNSNRCWNKV